MSSDAALLALGMVLPGAYCLALGRWLSWRWALGGLGTLIMGLMCSYVFMQMMGFAGGLTLTYGGVIALASALRGGPRPPATAQNA